MLSLAIPVVYHTTLSKLCCRLLLRLQLTIRRVWAFAGFAEQSPDAHSRFCVSPDVAAWTLVTEDHVP